MRTKLLALILLFFASSVGQALACGVCAVDPNSTTARSMSVAIWFLMAAVMSVLGGVGLFGFHLWRHERMPLEPHQELAEEDFNKYD